jgi:hypothetical protein
MPNAKETGNGLFAATASSSIKNNMLKTVYALYVVYLLGYSRRGIYCDIGLGSPFRGVIYKDLGCKSRLSHSIPDIGVP